MTMHYANHGFNVKSYKLCPDLVPDTKFMDFFCVTEVSYPIKSICIKPLVF